VSFGQDDPIFGYDISFHVFVVPVVQALIGALLTAFLLSVIVAVASGVAASRAALAGGDAARSRTLAERTRRRLRVRRAAAAVGAPRWSGWPASTC
jgi:uncharacterized membrane protein (UPF0182 family)